MPQVKVSSEHIADAIISLRLLLEKCRDQSNGHGCFNHPLNQTSGKCAEMIDSLTQELDTTKNRIDIMIEHKTIALLRDADARFKAADRAMAEYIAAGGARGRTFYDNPESRQAIVEAATRGQIPTSINPAQYNRDFPRSTVLGVWQCTWWACVRRQELGKPLFTSGNGKDVAQNAINAGVAKQSNVPVVGGYVSFAPGVRGADGNLGHVAIVEEVYPDGSYLISECSGGKVGSYKTRTVRPPYNGMTFTD